MRTAIPYSLRILVFDRDSWTCRYCLIRHGSEQDSPHVDHVIPVIQGGTNIIGNLVCSCAGCNLKKGGRTPKEAGMQLYEVPIVIHWYEVAYLPGKNGSRIRSRPNKK